MKCKRVVEAFERNRGQLQGFPIDVFYKNQFFAPKKILRQARKALIDLSKRVFGNSVYILNTRPLTSGFVNNKDDLIFDPIDWYYTEDERSQSFKKQLRLYSQ